jgi:hypothetical protein
MQDGFDPYQQWLGIPPAGHPPDHYRLLGLPAFTGDRAAISRAAQARIAQVRLADAGRQPELAERLVAELTLARQTLLDPPRKATYDAILRGARIAQAAAEPASKETPLDPRPAAPAGERAQQPPVVSLGAQAPLAAEPMAGGTWVSKPRLASHIVLFTGIAAVGTAAIVVGLILSLGSRPKVAGRDLLRFPNRPAAKKLAAPDLASAARLPQAASPSSRPSGSGGPPFPTPPANSQPNPPERMVAGSSPLKAANGAMGGESQQQPSPEVAARLTAARRAMFNRNLKAADEDVDCALRAARSDSDRAEAERVARLLRSLDNFWRAAADGCRQLQTGDELEIADTRVIVVSVDATGITIHAAGRNLDYAFQELPRPLAVLAAERRLSQDPQTMHLHVGSFLAVDRRGDRQEARRRWEKAGPDGQSLVPEIDLAPPVESVKPSK